MISVTNSDYGGVDAVLKGSAGMGFGEVNLMTVPFLIGKDKQTLQENINRCQRTYLKIKRDSFFSGYIWRDIV
ncbi:hypothetical protein [Niallia sp. 03190]|uniref:hypothetical protein n=1 Tax=Niallia sp. 03190 TaxID=3458061 RepID=UPI004044CCB0